MAKSKSRTNRPQRPSPPSAAVSSSRASLLRQTCRFLGTTAGLDLTLRLFQGLVLVSGHVATDDVVATRSLIASSQLDLGKPIPVTLSAGHLTTDNNSKELHDMKIHVVPWYTPVLVEANKFWFYAILASIARTLVLRVVLTASRSTKKEKQRQHQQLPSLRRLVVDALDLTLPASFVGWLALDDATIGCLMTVSTALTWRDVWAKAQK
ncbi:PEX11 domain protein [Cordyceps fumosorosea ARSEF 2679]|uniref:PEX11 domain protein n=1 Tax=Cordyceps fumosorosea (strain ARSEF 2679) TaxID=1081104 RepID=A0A167T0C6_CORFA|nr:PEX11 domain protein [Cordyceps fumosorosea ARSEF 2679]OAA60117.1 PEX11 domain protein [Cordyceps fumosorosea ARSEF 2679]